MKRSSKEIGAADAETPVAIITGASGGIGAATARLFGRKGWAVVLVARSQDKLRQVAVEITASGGQALVVPADVTVKADIERFVRRAVATFGRIDVVVNNAGVGLAGTLDTVDLGQLQYVFALNALAPIAVLQAVVPVMKAQGDGVIVNVSSLSEVAGIPFMAGYGASKAALGYLSDAAAVELSAYGIAVLKILPGVTETDFGHNVLHTGAAVTMETLLDKVGLLGVVKPEAVAQSIWRAVLTRRQQSYVTMGDRVIGMLARLSPATTVRVLKVAVRRYVPPAGVRPQASLRRDLVAFAAALGAVGAFLSLLAGYVFSRRRGKRQARP